MQQVRPINLSISDELTEVAFIRDWIPFGTSTKLVRIRLAFTQDLIDPVRIRSAI